MRRTDRVFPKRGALILGLSVIVGLFNADPIRPQVRPATEGQTEPTASPGQSQEGPVADVVRVKTRVVFIDTLVRDKKTGAPVTDLPIESFVVLDNGKPRKLSYFNRDGLSRRPLALLIVLDLSTNAILYLQRAEVMEEIIASLSKLKPQDEIAVAQVWYEPTNSPLSFLLESRIVSDLTRDRNATFASVRSVQQFAKQNLTQTGSFFSFKDSLKLAVKTGIASIPTGMVPTLTITPAADFIDMIDEAPKLARTRSDSQTVLLQVTDDLSAEGFGSSKKRANQLVDSEVTVNGMVVKRNLTAQGVNITGLLMSPFLGVRFHTLSYYSKQTGGEVLNVDTSEEFAHALERIIGGLVARYSLGFALDEDELADNTVHKLEVKIKPSSKSGRPLIVRARSSYVPR
jgi:VWFA-related protein